MTTAPIHSVQNAAPSRQVGAATLRPLSGEDFRSGAWPAWLPPETAKPHPLESGDFLRGLVPPKITGEPASGPMPKLSEFDYIPGARRTDGGTQHEKITRQAEKWVAQTFFGTLLKQMRESPFKSELFDGGRGGEAFAGMFDQHLAERMSRGAGAKLVRGIVRQIEGRKAYGKQAAASKKSGSAAAGADLNQSELPAQHPESALQPADEGAHPLSKVRIHVAPGFGT